MPIVMTQPYQPISSVYHDNSIHMPNNVPWSTAAGYTVDEWLLGHQQWATPYTSPIASPATERERLMQPQSVDVHNFPTPITSTSGAESISGPISEPNFLAANPLCEDDGLTTRLPKEEYPDPSLLNTVSAAPPLRKRGRPRKVRSPEQIEDERPARRQPHNQVERKYREGILAELDRLRLALPMSRCGIVNEAGTEYKVPKAAVLVGAVTYIHELEMQNELLRRENDVLRHRLGTNGD